MRIDVKRWVVAGLALLATVSASADAFEVDGTPIRGAIYDVFRSNWRQYAQYACEVDGVYAYFPSYDTRFESSINMTETQALEHLSVHYEERSGNLVSQRVRRPQRADAAALSRALPGLEVGNYGWIDSVEIVEIIDENQMLVRNVWLIDREELRRDYRADQAEMERQNNGEADHTELRFQYATRLGLMSLQEDRDRGYMDTFRLVGVNTRGLQVGDRWDGPNDEGLKIGVLRWEVPQAEDDAPEQPQSNIYRPGSTPNLTTRNRRSTETPPRLVIGPIEQPMRQNLTEQQFKHLLDDRGMTVTGFVELMREMREDDRDNADERIMNTLMPPTPEAARELILERRGT